MSYLQVWRVNFVTFHQLFWIELSVLISVSVALGSKNVTINNGYNYTEHVIHIVARNIG